MLGERLLGHKPVAILPFRGYTAHEFRDYRFFLRSSYKRAGGLGVEPTGVFVDEARGGLTVDVDVGGVELISDALNYSRYLDQARAFLAASFSADLTVYRSQRYLRRMNLSADSARWDGHTLIAASTLDGVFIVAIFFRRSYLPPLRDTCQDIRITFTGPLALLSAPPEFEDSFELDIDDEEGEVNGEDGSRAGRGEKVVSAATLGFTSTGRGAQAGAQQFLIREAEQIADSLHSFHGGGAEAAADLSAHDLILCKLDCLLYPPECATWLAVRHRLLPKTYRQALCLLKLVFEATKHLKVPRYDPQVALAIAKTEMTPEELDEISSLNTTERVSYFLEHKVASVDNVPGIDPLQVHSETDPSASTRGPFEGALSAQEGSATAIAASSAAALASLANAENLSEAQVIFRSVASNYTARVAKYLAHLLLGGLAGQNLTVEFYLQALRLSIARVATAPYQSTNPLSIEEASLPGTLLAFLLFVVHCRPLRSLEAFDKNVNLPTALLRMLSNDGRREATMGDLLKVLTTSFESISNSARLTLTASLPPAVVYNAPFLTALIDNGLLSLLITEHQLTTHMPSYADTQILQAPAGAKIVYRDVIDRALVLLALSPASTGAQRLYALLIAIRRFRSATGSGSTGQGDGRVHGENEGGSQARSQGSSQGETLYYSAEAASEISDERMTSKTFMPVALAAVTDMPIGTANVSASDTSSFLVTKAGIVVLINVAIAEDSGAVKVLQPDIASSLITLLNNHNAVDPFFVQILVKFLRILAKHGPCRQAIVDYGLVAPLLNILSSEHKSQRVTAHKNNAKILGIFSDLLADQPLCLDIFSTRLPVLDFALKILDTAVYGGAQLSLASAGSDPTLGGAADATFVVSCLRQLAEKDGRYRLRIGKHVAPLLLAKYEMMLLQTLSTHAPGEPITAPDTSNDREGLRFLAQGIAVLNACADNKQLAFELLSFFGFNLNAMFEMFASKKNVLKILNQLEQKCARTGHGDAAKLDTVFEQWMATVFHVNI